MTGRATSSSPTSAQIRKVVIATGAVTTLVDGTGAPVDTHGGAPLRPQTRRAATCTSPGNSSVRKLVIATGVVTTLAGGPVQSGSADGTGAAARFNRPHGIASDGAGNLYVADGANDTIRKIVVATGTVTTFAGAAGQAGTVDGTGAAARFAAPGALASDGAGNLYVADDNRRSGRSTSRPAPSPRSWACRALAAAGTGPARPPISTGRRHGRRRGG